MTLYARWEQNRYSITVSGDENGTANSNVSSAVEGELITLTATASSGYSFFEWQVIEGDITLSNTNPVTFFMPNKSVEVKAIFVPFVGLLEGIILSQDNYQTKGWLWYEYDSQNRIVKCTIYRSYSDEVWDFGSEHTLDYNTEGDLVKYDVCCDYGAPHTFFTINGNKITFSRSHKVTQQISHSENGEIELNEQGLPVRLTSESKTHHSTYGTSTSFYTFILTWQNGNLTKIDWELSQTGYEGEYTGKSSGTNTYTHDDKKPLFYYCDTPKWFLWWLDYYDKYDNAYNENYGYNENNIKTETWEEDGVTRTKTYEYTYNDDGFPVTRTWVNDDSFTNTETYTYK
jgi:hypothetical protein